MKSMGQGYLFWNTNSRLGLTDNLLYHNTYMFVSYIDMQNYFIKSQNSVLKIVVSFATM